jgi:CRISPR type IV-associated protein Csf3
MYNKKVLKLVEDRKRKYKNIKKHNYKITFKMQNAVCLNDYLMIDSLLAYAVLKDILGNQFENVTNSDELIDVPLPLKRTDNIWHASAGVFNVIDTDQGSWKKRWDSTDNHLVNPNKKRSGKYSLKIDVGSGPNKAYSMPLQLYLTKKISFYINGNKNEVTRLLQNNIRAVGKKRSQGYGFILDMKIKKDDQDNSILKNGKDVMRPVTEGVMYQNTTNFGDVNYIKRYMPVVPPYWNAKESVQALAPENINVKGCLE